MHILLPAVLSSFLTLLALMPVGYGLYRNLPPHIATVDLQALLEEERQRILHHPDRASTDFAQQLSLTMDALGQECGCVIVNKAALLGGQSIDYTDHVRKGLRQRLQR